MLINSLIYNYILRIVSWRNTRFRKLKCGMWALVSLLPLACALFQHIFGTDEGGIAYSCLAVLLKSPGIRHLGLA